MSIDAPPDWADHAVAVARFVASTVPEAERGRLIYGLAALWPYDPAGEPDRAWLTHTPDGRVERRT